MATTDERGLIGRLEPDAEPARLGFEPRRPREGRLVAGGVIGNGRLTAITGALLLVLFAALGVTIVLIGRLLWLHLFVGLFLIGPVVVKLSSTLYRFGRYYTHNPAYRRKGPPPPLLRLLGPVVVLSTIGVFATGVVLLFLGRHGAGENAAFLLHKVTFIVWIVAIGVHVLAHLPELPAALTRSRQVHRDVHALRVALDSPARRLLFPAPDAEGGSESGGALRVAAVRGGAGRALVTVLGLAGGLAIALALVGQFHVWTG